MPLQMNYGVTPRITDDYIYLVIILKTLLKEEYKPHLHDIKCVYRHVTLRHIHDLMQCMTFSTNDDKALLSKYSS